MCTDHQHPLVIEIYIVLQTVQNGRLVENPQMMSSQLQHRFAVGEDLVQLDVAQAGTAALNRLPPTSRAPIRSRYRVRTQ